MSIRWLARDLYRLQQDVDRLEAALAQAPPEQRLSIEDRLRAARKEKNYLKRALDGRIGRTS